MRPEYKLLSILKIPKKTVQNLYSFNETEDEISYKIVIKEKDELLQEIVQWHLLIDEFDIKGTLSETGNDLFSHLSSDLKEITIDIRANRKLTLFERRPGPIRIIKAEEAKKAKKPRRVKERKQSPYFRTKYGPDETPPTYSAKGYKLGFCPYCNLYTILDPRFIVKKGSHYRKCKERYDNEIKE